MREYLCSEYFKQFESVNENLEINLYLKRTGHPFITASYINGFVKDVPLYKKNLADVIHAVNQATTTSGLTRGPVGLR